MMNLEHMPDTLSADGQSLLALNTPCLLLDERKLSANINRMRRKLAPHAVVFRPHLKTAKCLEVARRMMTRQDGPAIVSTLHEAEIFAEQGIKDMVYGIGVAPDKIGRVNGLRRKGVDLAMLVDSPGQARAVAAQSDPHHPLSILIEIDCDGHRSGVGFDSTEQLLAIAREITPEAVLRGVFTHAGESYEAKNIAAIEAAAEQERLAAVTAATILRQAGHACPVVSIGSTPTALHGRRFDGVSEVRAGVYAFFDLFQAGLGICRHDDIVLSVLTTVIGHQEAKGWIITDAGWMALSRDRGTARQAIDQGYGLVCNLEGHPLTDLMVAACNQEHGVITLRSGSREALPDLPIGTRLRILPNHACATAAQHKAYHVIGEAPSEISAIWPRFSGW